MKNPVLFERLKNYSLLLADPRPAVKKIISILLLFSLLLNIVGYHIIFHLRQVEIKSEMKTLLRLRANSEDEIDFVFSVNDKKGISKLEWEGDDEFRLNGQMYDLIEKKIEGNKLVLRCISDEKETSLIKKFAKMNTEANSKGKLALLMQLFSSSYLPTSNTEMILGYKPVPSIIHFQADPFSSQVRDVLTPPPQVC